MPCAGRGVYMPQSCLIDAGLNFGLFAGAEVSTSTMDEASFNGADFYRANMVCVKMRKVWARKSLFVGANMLAIDAAGAVLEGSRFTDAMLGEANFTGAVLRGCRFDGANLSGACFREADLTGADLTGANLTGADFTGARMP